MNTPVAGQIRAIVLIGMESALYYEWLVQRAVTELWLMRAWKTRAQFWLGPCCLMLYAMSIVVRPCVYMRWPLKGVGGLIP